MASTSSTASGPEKLNYQEIVEATSEPEQLKEEYYRCKLGGMDVFMRVMYNVNCEEVLPDILSESRMIQPNLQKLMGYSSKEEENTVVLVYKFLPPLDKYLEEAARPLNWGQRVRIALGVVRGLNFLHNSGSVYGNLDLSKIVIGDGLEPQLREVGVAKYQWGNGPNIEPGIVKFDRHSDVYAIGNILLDLIGGKRTNCPVDPDEPQLERVLELARSCLGDRQERPNMKAVLDGLQSIYAERKKEDAEFGEMVKDELEDALIDKAKEKVEDEFVAPGDQTMDANAVDPAVGEAQAEASTNCCPDYDGSCWGFWGGPEGPTGGGTVGPTGGGAEVQNP